MKGMKRDNKEQRWNGGRGIRFFKVLGLTAILLSVLGLGTISQVEKSVSVEIPDLPAECIKQEPLDFTCPVPTGSTLKFTVRGVAVPRDRVELFAEGLPANASFRCTPTSPCSGTGSVSETFSFTPTTDQGGHAFLVTFKATAFGLTDVKRVRFNVAPRASFRANPFNALVNTPVTFDASSSLASPGRRIERYIWDFGDGSRQEVTTPIIQHTYTQAGTFTVRLTVVDSGGAQATASTPLTVIRPEDVQRVKSNITSTLPILTAPEPVTLDPPKILESIQKGEVVELPILGKGNIAEAVPVRLEPNPLVGPIVTFKGSATIEGQPNSVVRLTVTRSFISGYILMDGLWSFIEPLEQFQISPADTPFNHFVYNATGNDFKLDLSWDAPPRAESSSSSQLDNYPQGVALQTLSHPSNSGLSTPPSGLATTAMAMAAQQVPEPFSVLLQPLSLRFKAVKGGKNPEPHEITIKNNLDSSLSWSVSAKDHAGQPLPWLTLTPTSGSLSPRGGEASIKASVDISGLPRDFFQQGRITISAGGTQKELDVSLLVCPSGDECLLERELPIAFVIDEEFRRQFLQKVRITIDTGQEQEIERWKLEPQGLSNFVEGILAFTQPCLPQGTFKLKFRLVPQDQKEPLVIDVRETDGLRLREELASKLKDDPRLQGALLVHLLTGKDLKLRDEARQKDELLFGIAWQAPKDYIGAHYQNGLLKGGQEVDAGLGTPYSQSISQMAPEPIAGYRATLYQRVMLIAHELGHSLGAAHAEFVGVKKDLVSVPEECLGALAKLTFPAGSTVATGDSDVGNTLVPFDPKKEKYLDENNNEAYDPEEVIYRDEDEDGKVSTKDKRLMGCGQGVEVVANDPDIDKALRPFATSEKHTESGQGNNRYDLGENIYKDMDNNGRVSSGDIRLMAVGALLKPNLMCSAFTGDHVPAFGSKNDGRIREVLRERISK